ncbi:hypothetical protein U1Q18_031744 [Sarracenia purpurea var. burkii]
MLLFKIGGSRNGRVRGLLGQSQELQENQRPQRHRNELGRWIRTQKSETIHGITRKPSIQVQGLIPIF